jgi:superfamily II DNA or RNA helicase
MELLLREWQEAARLAWRQRQGENFLLVATPGSGKTQAALAIAKGETDIDRIIVVVPTHHLRGQWQRAAWEVGVELKPWGNEPSLRVPKDLKGLVLTYPQVDKAPELHRALVARQRTLVIFDEPHHAGWKASWGESLRYAYEPATARLLLSGTPFRTDGDRIPFVHYDAGGQCVMQPPHGFHYGYRAALADGFCRSLSFTPYEGHLEWLDENGEQHAASFADPLSRRDAGRRLATALDPRVEWLRQVLAAADMQLTYLRETENADAGGLVVAVDTYHADAIAELLSVIAREPVTVAHSNLLEDDASERIEHFRQGRSKWLVAVNMVSEGVDIHRLRVGVYATRKATQMIFAQICGRFVRRQPWSEDGWAHMFIPKDPELARLAKDVEDDVSAYHRMLLDADEDDDHGDDDDDGNPTSSRRRTWMPTSGTAYEEGRILAGADFTNDELRRAREIHVGLPRGCATVEGIALALRKYDGSAPIPTPEPMTLATARPRPDPRAELWTLNRRLVAELGERCRPTQDGRTAYEALNTRLKKQFGAGLRELTIEQLQQRAEILRQWIQQAKKNASI